MALGKTGICDFGRKARDFKLKGVDGKSYTLADVRGPKGTVVVFICNHCPYVKASIDRIVAEAKAMRNIGIGTIAIMPNDTATYREDSFDNMKAFALKHGAPAHGAWRKDRLSPFPTLSMRRRKWRELMTLSARPTFSDSTRRTSCSIVEGWTRRACSL